MPESPELEVPKAEGTTPKPRAARRKTAPSSIRKTAATNGAAPKKPVAASKKTASPAAKSEVKTESVKTAAPQETPASVARAEDTLDEWGKVVGGLFVSVGKRLTKAAVVAREELEDLWAEAQSIRRGDTK